MSASYTSVFGFPCGFLFFTSIATRGTQKQHVFLRLKKELILRHWFCFCRTWKQHVFRITEKEICHDSRPHYTLRQPLAVGALSAGQDMPHKTHGKPGVCGWSKWSRWHWKRLHTEHPFWFLLVVVETSGDVGTAADGTRNIPFVLPPMRYQPLFWFPLCTLIQVFEVIKDHDAARPEELTVFKHQRVTVVRRKVWKLLQEGSLFRWRTIIKMCSTMSLYVNNRQVTTVSSCTDSLSCALSLPYYHLWSVCLYILMDKRFGVRVHVCLGCMFYVMVCAKKDVIWWELAGKCPFLGKFITNVLMSQVFYPTTFVTRPHTVASYCVSVKCWVLFRVLCIMSFCLQYFVCGCGELLCVMHCVVCLQCYVNSCMLCMHRVVLSGILCVWLCFISVRNTLCLCVCNAVRVWVWFIVVWHVVCRLSAMRVRVCV